VRVRATFMLLAVAASTALIASPAAAEENSTLVIDPGTVGPGLNAVENYGAVEVVAPVREDLVERAIVVRPRGTVTVALPPQVELAEPSEVLREVDGPGYYPAPATAVGGNRYRLQLPDAEEGDSGRLYLHPRLSTTVDVDPLGPWNIKLQFSRSAPTDVSVTEQIVFQGNGCATPHSWDCPPAASVAAGGVLTLTLPATSPLVALGIPDLSRIAFSLQPEDSSSDALALTPPALAAGEDSRTATVSIPPGTAAGRYLFNLVVGGPTSQSVAITRGYVTVLPPAAAPAEPTATVPTTAPAPTAEPAPPVEVPDQSVTATAAVTASSATPLYLLGAGVLVVVAGVAGAVLVRRRKAGATEEAPPAPPTEELVGSGAP
jgi:hypothetical protein